MSAGRGHSGIKARIGNAENTDAAVVMWYILHQPVDGVVRITGLIDIGGLLVFYKRPDIREVAFAHPAAADILRDDDITFSKIITEITGSKIPPMIFPIWRAGIRRPLHQDRVL